MKKVKGLVIVGCLLVFVLSPVTAQVDGQQCNSDSYKKSGINFIETQTIILNNVSNSFPMFSNAEYVYLTISNNSIILTLDSNASFDGVYNLSNLTGADTSAANSTAELYYEPISYQNSTYDEKWKSTPYFNVSEHRLYLLSGSGPLALELNITEKTIDKTLPKVVGVGDFIGDFALSTLAQGKDSSYNYLTSSMQGEGYADLYVQYAPDTSYEKTPFLPTFSQCEKVQEILNSSISGSESTVGYKMVISGVANGAEPIAGVSHDWNLSLRLQLEEETPITYQNETYDQKWTFAPYFNESEHRLYLLGGSGPLALELNITEKTIDKTLPKVVGVGDLVGDFQIGTLAQGKDSSYNYLTSSMQGEGYADLYVQYAPDTSYEKTPFLPTFSQCKFVQEDIYSAISGTESIVEYGIAMNGFANGAQSLSGVSHDWNLSLMLQAEHSPTSYLNHSYNQTLSFTPYFSDTEHKLHFLSGSGDIAVTLKMIENTTDKTLPKVVGVGELVGDFQIGTSAQGRNSTYNNLTSAIQGIGYADLYVQYAPDTSYEDITFIPTFSQCEELQLLTYTFGPSIDYFAVITGIAHGVEYLNFNNIPLDNVTINGTFHLDNHPVNISGTILNETWSLKPVQYEDTLVLLRGTGNITKLNFTVDDTAEKHPEIISYGVLSGDYNITSTIHPHYMRVIANGTDVAAMDESGEGGFGITFDLYS